jgi:hypothetical protein
MFGSSLVRTASLGCPPKVAFWGLLLLWGVVRAWAIWVYPMHYTEEDQALMWQAATVFAQGHFPEPMFFGQNYLTMLEALFAVPLLWLQVPAPIALPIAASLLAMAPFALLAFVARKHNPALAVLILLMAISLSPRYDFLTSIARGFLPGNLALLPLLWHLHTPRLKAWQAGLMGLGVGALPLLNPTFALLGLPLLLLWVLRQPQNLQMWAGLVVGLAVGYTAYYFAQNFYEQEPLRTIHQMTHLHLSLKSWSKVAASLDRFWGMHTPFAWGLSLGAVGLLGLAGIRLYRQKKWPEFSAWALFAVLMLLSWGINRVQNGFDAVNYTVARYYLCLPMGLAVFVYLSFRGSPIRPFTPWLVLAAVAFVSIKIAIGPNVAARQNSLRQTHQMTPWRMQELCRTCAWMHQLTQRTSTPNPTHPLAVVGIEPALAYGCPILKPGLPVVLYDGHERRNWLLEQTAPQRHFTELWFFGKLNPECWSGLPARLQPQPQDTLHQPNRLLDYLVAYVIPLQPTDEPYRILKLLGVGLRPFVGAKPGQHR